MRDFGFSYCAVSIQIMPAGSPRLSFTKHKDILISEEYYQKVN